MESNRSSIAREFSPVTELSLLDVTVLVNLDTIAVRKSATIYLTLIDVSVGLRWSMQEFPY